MKASILTIGDEILIGQIVDTNSASIARHLNNAGIVVWERTSVGDQREQITEAVKRAMNQSDVVILTGGLGPTKDDITKKTLAELFGSRLVCDQTVADHVRRMLEARGIEYNRLNRDQALVPACCTVLFNAHGTAPGMWFEQNDKVVVSLPGVPFEMEHLMTDEVMPRLKARFSLRQIVHRTLITAGLAESMLAEKIADWENALPPYLHLAYLPAPGVVRLRLSAYEVEGESVSHEIDRQFAALQRIIPRYVLGFERATMQEIVHNLLTQRRQTLATAESCTGGSIAARFTAMPGASAYFLCGVVAYSNESKNNLLGVDPEPGRRQRGGRTANGRRSTPHHRSRLCRRNHRHRRSCGRYGTETRRHGLDGRSRPAPYRDPAQTMRHRPGTGYRPGERLRTRAPARRNRTGRRRRVDFTRSPAPIIDPVAPNCGNPFRKSDSGKTRRLRGHSDGFPHEMKWLRNSHTESMTSGFFEPAALLPTIFGIGLHPEKTPRFLLFGQKIVYLHSPKWDYN